jgi:hypothetical protein
VGKNFSAAMEIHKSIPGVWHTYVRFVIAQTFFTNLNKVSFHQKVFDGCPPLKLKFGRKYT